MREEKELWRERITGALRSLKNDPVTEGLAETSVRVRSSKAAASHASGTHSSASRKA